MNEVEFTAEDFEDLTFIEEFNKEHWKGKGADLGWKYDVDQKDPQIDIIKSSLYKIKEKLETLRKYFEVKKNFKGLTSRVQKITYGITNIYLSQLWFYFIKGIEKRPPNEPQLQFSINPKDINISLWFENAIANRSYLSNFIDNYSDYLKRDDRISIEVYGSGLDGKNLDNFKNTEWDKFTNQIVGLNFDCKVGFTYFIQKDEVLKKGKNVIGTIEEYMERMKFYFDKATPAISVGVRIFKRSEKEFFNLLANKKQVILYGPPGTGKTYKTKDFAVKFLKSD